MPVQPNPAQVAISTGIYDKEVRAHLQPHLVRIKAFAQEHDTEPSSVGSGFQYDATAPLVITANHLVKGCAKVLVAFQDSTGQFMAGHEERVLQVRAWWLVTAVGSSL